MARRDGDAAEPKIELRKAKIAIFDIENAPDIIAAWERYEQNALWVERDWFMLSFAFRWYGEKKIHTFALPDYAGYSKSPYDDSKLASDLHAVFNEADILVGHNIRKFDIPKANWRFKVHGLPFYGRKKTYDTLTASRKLFKSNDNSLNGLCRALYGEEKAKHSGLETWRKCMGQDMAEWKNMVKYNAKDVALNTRIYEDFRGWDPAHPNVILEDVPDTLGRCPTCGNANLDPRGWKEKEAMRYRQYFCNPEHSGCGAWPRARKGERISGIVLAT